MDRRILSALIVVACASTALAEHCVQTYSRSSDPSRSEGLRSRRSYIPAGDPRPGLLITPAPFPTNRTDSPDRPEIGRVWEARAPIGNRTPIRETVWGHPGPASFGAPADAVHEVIWVQPAEIDAVVAVSPWQRIDDHTLRQILRQEKNLGRTRFNPSSARLLNELRQAQDQWLREQGYIRTVRTHVSPHADGAGEAPAVRPTAVQPRGVIRVVPNNPGKVANAHDGSPVSPEDALASSVER